MFLAQLVWQADKEKKCSFKSFGSDAHFLCSALHFLSAVLMSLIIVHHTSTCLKSVFYPVAVKVEAKTVITDTV